MWRYTAERGSPEQAEHYHRDLIGTMEALARGKKTGRICVVRDGYFRYPAGSHVVFYRETDETIDVHPYPASTDGHRTTSVVARVECRSRYKATLNPDRLCAAPMQARHRSV
ncbi:type II toxin-antitoxin system RelE/ParE family toxin [Burkholderia sp. BCC0419]|uniref:type II toxin-antitoxin system RelE/ParE family toxin n=1 Tax=Burkholderia sp. BCC0419 TaxID=486878 RepID=UPI001FC7D87C|nr:type II toxin-antitoxin system RelE/ParE family toxin [Burkholderia sp. BCC0419]